VNGMVIFVSATLVAIVVIMFQRRRNDRQK
jgi:hypothetical protein